MSNSRYRTLSVDEATEFFRQTGGAHIVCFSEEDYQSVDLWLEQVNLRTKQQYGRSDRVFKIYTLPLTIKVKLTEWSGNRCLRPSAVLLVKEGKVNMISK